MKYDITDTMRKSSIKVISILFPFMLNEDIAIITRIISSNALIYDTFIPRPASSTREFTKPETTNNPIIRYILSF